MVKAGSMLVGRRMLLLMIRALAAESGERERCDRSSWKRRQCCAQVSSLIVQVRRFKARGLKVLSLMDVNFSTERWSRFE